jgi:hypothetical protein
MMKLRLECEYLAWPVFCPDVASMGHVNVEDLPISEELKIEILLWDEEYQATYNSAYPPDSGFESTIHKAAHSRKGAELAERLQDELGEGYAVEYQL